MPGDREVTRIWSEDGDHVQGHLTVYVSIGNSDDKLTQAQWAQFGVDLIGILHFIRNSHIHGIWYSAPNSRYQNMCVCIELPELYTSAPEIYLEELKQSLRNLAKKYGQDSISWAEVGDQRFLGEQSGDSDGDSTT